MNNIYRRVLAFHLDSIKKFNISNKLYSRLTYLKRGINIIIFIYALAECIICDP